MCTPPRAGWHSLFESPFENWFSRPFWHIEGTSTDCISVTRLCSNPSNPELQDGKVETYTERVRVNTHSARASGIIPSQDWAWIISSGSSKILELELNLDRWSIHHSWWPSSGFIQIEIDLWSDSIHQLIGLWPDPDVAEDLTPEFLPNTTATQTQIETLIQKNVGKTVLRLDGLTWNDMDLKCSLVS